MARDAKYGSIEVEGIPEDEPVFIIRARDSLSIAAIYDYAERAEQAQVDETVLDGLETALDEFREYRLLHTTKLPG